MGTWPASMSPPAGWGLGRTGPGSTTSAAKACQILGNDEISHLRIGRPVCALPANRSRGSRLLGRPGYGMESACLSLYDRCTSET